MNRLAELIERVEKAEKLGFEGYCTDCESATFLNNGRCGCGSGRVVTSSGATDLKALAAREGAE